MYNKILAARNKFTEDPLYNVSAVNSGITSAKINSTLNEKGETVGTPTDVADISGKSAASTTGSKRSAKEIFQSISVLCQKYSLDINKLKTGIENITGLVKDEDKKLLSETQQAVMLETIENALLHAIKYKEKNPNIDIVEEVLFDSLLTCEVLIKNKTFNDLKSFDEEVNANASDFIEGISKINSVEEFEKLKNGLEAELKEKFNEKLEEIAKLPESERPAATERLKEQHRAMRQRLLSHYVFGKTSNEVSMNAMTTASSKDTGKMQKGLYKMQSSDKARQQLAVEYHSFGLDKKILNAQKERGEEPNQESWEEYVQINASWKDEKSLNQYHTDVMTAANEGKLDKQVFKATTKGIGIGAQINHVLSAEEKTSFIERWTSDIKNYYGADSEEYKEVKAYVEQKVEEYNKAQIEKQSAEPKAEKPNSTVQIPQSSQTRKNYTNPIELARKSSKPYNDILNIDRASESEHYQKAAIVREGILSKELKTITEIKEALGVSSELEAIEFIAKDPQLKISEEKRIISYVRAQDIHNGNVETLAINVPSIMDLILPNIKSEYVQEFVNNVKMKIGYEKRKILEMKTKDKNKEAEGVA